MGSKALVPKLRFPEFHGAPDWDEDAFGTLYRFAPTYTFSRDQLNYTTGSVKNVHYGDIHTRFRALFDIRHEVVPFINPEALPNGPSPNSLCAEGDMLFADASEDVEDVGKSIEIVELDGQQLVSGTHTILAKRVDSRLIVGFGGHLFRSPRVRSQIRRESQGAKVLGLSPGRLSFVPISYPLDCDEQRKIADCLTSLDDLISAEGRRLETLRQWKKALLQNLFPRKGETTPRLRFPEFHSGGEWGQRKLEDIADVINTRVPLSQLARDDYVSTESILSDFVGLGSTKSFPSDGSAIRFHVGDVLISNIRPYLRKVWHATKSGGASNDVIVFRSKTELKPDYLALLLRNDAFIHYVMASAKGVKMPRGDIRLMKEYPVSVPSEREQHVIATSLGSLDILITEQAKKLDTLKTHKQGLMHGLFPSPARGKDA